MTAPSENPFGSTVVPAQYQGQVILSAAKWGISPSVLAAQLSAESGFNPHAISPDGAVGIAQFLPSTARAHGIDPNDPLAAIDGMAKLASEYLREFGSIDKALAAYNAGPGAVTKYGGVPPFAETQNYVKKILDAAGSIITPSGIADILTDPLAPVTSLADKLTQPEWWRRIGLGVLGLGVAAVGVYFLLSKEGYKIERKIQENIP